MAKAIENSRATAAANAAAAHAAAADNYTKAIEASLALHQESQEQYSKRVSEEDKEINDRAILLIANIADSEDIDIGSLTDDEFSVLFEEFKNVARAKIAAEIQQRQLMAPEIQKIYNMIIERKGAEKQLSLKNFEDAQLEAEEEVKTILNRAIEDLNIAILERKRQEKGNRAELSNANIANAYSEAEERVRRIPSVYIKRYRLFQDSPSKKRGGKRARKTRRRKNSSTDI